MVTFVEEPTTYCLVSSIRERKREKGKMEGGRERKGEREREGIKGERMEGQEERRWGEGGLEEGRFFFSWITQIIRQHGFLKFLNQLHNLDF